MAAPAVAVPAFDPAHPDARAAAPVGGAVYGPALLALINQLAPRYNLNPAVPLAVAPHEGGFQGAIGDQGTSFGPWQLHEGGALPAWVTAQGPQFAERWANSQPGVSYALQGIARATQGLQGPAAVRATVTGFERPAAQYVQGEVAKALASYNGGAPVVPPGTGPVAPPAFPAANPQIGPLAGGLTQTPAAKRLTAQLAQQTQAHTNALHLHNLALQILNS